MGFNTSVVVLNDALHSIEKDDKFGKNLAQAIYHLNSFKFTNFVSSGPNVNAAEVIGCYHADYTQLIAIGGNYGTLLGLYLGDSHHEEDKKVQLLKSWARDLGYEIRRRKQ